MLDESKQTNHFQMPYSRRVMHLMLLAYLLVISSNKVSAFAPPIRHRYYPLIGPKSVTIVSKHSNSIMPDARGPYSINGYVVSSTTTVTYVRNDDNDESSVDDDDAKFYQDLQKAKKKKLGSQLPPDQLKESAISAEQEFLQAMQQSKEELKKAKQENIDLSATEFFLEKIRQTEKEEAMEDDEDLSTFE